MHDFRDLRASPKTYMMSKCILYASTPQELDRNQSPEREGLHERGSPLFGNSQWSTWQMSTSLPQMGISECQGIPSLTGDCKKNISLGENCESVRSRFEQCIF
jgi:hypothetical protein